LEQRFGLSEGGLPGGWRLLWAGSSAEAPKTRRVVPEGLPDLRVGVHLVLEWEEQPPPPLLEWFGTLEACHIADSSLKEVALEACVEQFTAREELGEENAVRCDACKQSGRAAKKIDIWTVPPVLVLQLKRFEYVIDDRVRLETPVCFPLEGLDLIASCLAADCRTFPEHAYLRIGEEVQLEGLRTDETRVLNGTSGAIVRRVVEDSSQVVVKLDSTVDSSFEAGQLPVPAACLRPVHPVASPGAECSPVFDLAGVCTHFGSASYGHYTAYARSSEDGKWRLFNDEDVKEVSAEEVAEEKVGAYILFYVRRDARPASWGEPEPAKRSEG